MNEEIKEIEEQIERLKEKVDALKEPVSIPEKGSIIYTSAFGISYVNTAFDEPDEEGYIAVLSEHYYLREDRRWEYLFTAPEVKERLDKIENS